MPVKRVEACVFCFIVILLAAAPGVLFAGQDITNLQFPEPQTAGSDEEKSVQSLVKIQGTGQFREDGLYLMTQLGDREELFRKENQSLLEKPLINRSWRFCSLFSARNGDRVFMGRNWDNQNVGSIIVSFYSPPNGYSSVSFTRSISLDFSHKDLEPLKDTPFGDKLLLAPFYAFDGINEHGLSVGVAGVNPVKLTPDPERELVYAPFLVRKMLDQAQSVEEAVQLVDDYVPFDRDTDSLNTHYFVVDAAGRSVILEYTGDRWATIYGNSSSQVMTTKPVFNVSDVTLSEQCWRYRSLSENIARSGEMIDWQACLDFLQDASQFGTTWSIVYSPSERDLFFSVYQDWDTVYYYRMPR